VFISHYNGRELS